jgi:hypothetical protein
MKPAQCQGVISIESFAIYDLRFIVAPTANSIVNRQDRFRLQIPDLRRRRVLHGHLRRADVRAFALVPPQHDRAGDVDGRVGAGDDADQEGEREVVDDAAAPDEQRQRGQNTVPLVMIVRLKVWLSAWLMMSLNEPRTPSFKSSRMRSKMTILSLMEKPMMVSTAATTVALNWRPETALAMQ